MTLCEVTDVAERVLEESTVQEYVETLVDYGVESVDVGECWRTAAAYENEHAVALGDAIVLATAEWKGATVLVGADADFQTAPDEMIERFRSESALVTTPTARTLYVRVGSSRDRHDLEFDLFAVTR